MKKMQNIGFIKKMMVHMGLTKKNSFPKIQQSNLKLSRSINDLFVDNFRNIIKTGDTRYLYKLEDYTELPKEFPEKENWENIFWEYIDAKGIDYKYKLRLELKSKIEILKNEEIFEGKNNEIKIMLAEMRLKDLEVKPIKNADIKNDAVLTKFFGVLIDPKKITVSQYIGLEDLLKETNKQQEKLNGNIKR